MRELGRLLAGGADAAGVVGRSGRSQSGRGPVEQPALWPRRRCGSRTAARARMPARPCPCRPRARPGTGRHWRSAPRPRPRAGTRRGRAGRAVRRGGRPSCGQDTRPGVAERSAGADDTRSGPKERGRVTEDRRLPQPVLRIERAAAVADLEVQHRALERGSAVADTADGLPGRHLLALLAPGSRRGGRRACSSRCRGSPR